MKIKEYKQTHGIGKKAKVFKLVISGWKEFQRKYLIKGKDFICLIRMSYEQPMILVKLKYFIIHMILKE